VNISCREKRPNGSNEFFKTKLMGHHKKVFKLSDGLFVLLKFILFHTGYVFLQDVLFLFHRDQHRTSYQYDTVYCL